jgi:DNA-binding HxlR family transcriptional regulator
MFIFYGVKYIYMVKQMAKQELNLLSKKIRAKILQTLIQTETPLHFLALHKKVKPMSTRTLSKHLITLEKEGLISRKIEGRKIVFEVNKPKTIIELRKEFFEQFLSLLRAYETVLNQKTNTMTQSYLEAIKESIEKPEIKGEKAFIRTVEYEKSVKIPISKPYEPLEFTKAKTIKCQYCGEQHQISEDMHGFYYECPKEKKIKRIEKPKEPNLTIEPLNLKRKKKYSKNPLS